MDKQQFINYITEHPHNLVLHKSEWTAFNNLGGNEQYLAYVLLNKGLLEMSSGGRNYEIVDNVPYADFKKYVLQSLDLKNTVDRKKKALKYGKISEVIGDIRIKDIAGDLYDRINLIYMLVVPEDLRVDINFNREFNNVFFEVLDNAHYLEIDPYSGALQLKHLFNRVNPELITYLIKATLNHCNYRMKKNPNGTGSSVDLKPIENTTGSPAQLQVLALATGLTANLGTLQSAAVVEEQKPIVVEAKKTTPKWTALPDKTVIERVAGTNPGEAYTVLDKDTLSLIAKGWNISLKDLYAVEANAVYEKNPKRLRVGQLVYRPGLPAAVEFVDNSLQLESLPLVAVIEEPLQEVIKLVKDEDHYVPDYEAYLQLEYPNMVELETEFVPYSKRQLRFLLRNRDALRQAYKYDLKNGTDTYWLIMSKMPTKRVGGILNPLPKRRI